MATNESLNEMADWITEQGREWRALGYSFAQDEHLQKAEVLRELAKCVPPTSYDDRDLSVLTIRQREVYSAICTYANEHGYAPSIRELCKIMSLASTSTIHGHIKNLIKKGFIQTSPTFRHAMKIL